MDKTPNQEEFYSKLEVQLIQGHNFPDHYTFKFIFKNEPEPLTELYHIFDGLECSIATKESKNGTYISANIHCFVLDAAQVVAIYKKVGLIKNIIML